jgi:hypothetical protein
MRLVEHDYTLLAHLCRYVLRDFGIEKIVERVDHDVEVG